MKKEIMPVLQQNHVMRWAAFKDEKPTPYSTVDLKYADREDVLEGRIISAADASYIAKYWPDCLWSYSRLSS